MKKKRVKVDRFKIIKAIFSWFIFIGFINVFPPENILHFIVFYLFLFLSLFQTFKLIFPTFRSICWIAILVAFLILKQGKIDNIINIILLLGILATLEIYFRKV